ncbi:PKD domain-containing protein [Methanosarcina sp.]|uniref:PKD domain-containing protein n=1 Tax=Methanosarcina sp. TaxID=2213 RepID=UPI003C734C52
MGANRIVLLVAIVLIAGVICSPASAKQIIAGNDPQAKFSSIQEAVDNSSSGDVILVLPGIYNERVNVNVEGLSILSRSGNPENTVVTAFTVSANNVVISGFGIQEYITTDINQGVQYCTFKHNKFPGINSDVGPIGIDAVNCFNCIFSDNIFSNSGIGLNAGGDITNVTIANNTIKGGSITLGGSSENRILNNSVSNTISDNGESYGLNLPESHDNIITNNSISGCNYAILMCFLTGGNNVSNNTLTSNSKGIVIDHLSPGNEVKNNMISNNDIGISIGSSCPNTLITGNRIQLNRDYGIYIEQTSTDPSFEESSLIYNNLFNNTVNLFNNTVELQYGEPINTIWNTTKISGTSIAGGPYLGGNYWAEPDGSGLSQNCNDWDSDGICDSIYTISANDIDYLPLTALSDQQLVFPVANFSANVTAGNIPLTVLFTDLSRNATSRSWDFNNDGITDSTDANPLYVYTTPGIYTVNLTVNNANGTVSRLSMITALPAPPIDGFILKETQITVNKSNQSQPAIYGNRIVWNDDRNRRDYANVYDLYVYDVSTSKEARINSSGLWPWKPSIYEDRIVWQEYRRNNNTNVWDKSDIYMYNLSTSEETRITTSGKAFYPDIHGNRIVWTDIRNGNGDIYMYDLSTSRETRITTDEAHQDDPAIYGDIIIWEDSRNGEGYNPTDIYMYNISTSEETQVTADDSDQYSPAIYGDKIVWADWRNRNWDIYMYNLSTSTETRITIDDSAQEFPAIFGNRIVWHDLRNGNYDIYMYNFSTQEEIPITTNKSDQTYPAINGNRIVWEDYRNGNNWYIDPDRNADIYTCTVFGREQEQKVPVADFFVNTTSGYAPLKVLFTDNSTGSPTSWLWDFGDGIYSKHAMNATHTFTKPGKYNISLTVANEHGNNTVTKPVFITVKALKAPVADFSANVTSGDAPLKVLFTDNSTGAPESWFWDFGDGIYSKHAMNATHTFKKPGIYNVTLKVTNAAGSNSITRHGYITVMATTPTVKPVADFYSPEAEEVLNQPSDHGIYENEVVSFFDNSTGSPASWEWDFGDGNTSTLKNPAHVYGKMGGYTVNLTVKNAAGSGTISKYGYVLVGIGDEPASPAYFSSDVTSGSAPLTVIFLDDKDAEFPNYPIWRQWDFGDGVIQSYMVDSNESATPYAMHVYEKPGKYTVTLYLDNRGGKSIITKYHYITVTTPDTIPDMPVADFSANVTSGKAPLIVKFTDTSTGSPASWYWDFGDGIYSKHAMNATHTYTGAGNYDVTLTVKNAAGSNIARKTGYIKVESR